MSQKNLLHLIDFKIAANSNFKLSKLMQQLIEGLVRNITTFCSTYHTLSSDGKILNIGRCLTEPVIMWEVFWGHGIVTTLLYQTLPASIGCVAAIMVVIFVFCTSYFCIHVYIQLSISGEYSLIFRFAFSLGLCPICFLKICIELDL